MTYCTCTWHAHTHPLWNWKWHWKGHGFEHVRGTRHEDVIELGDGNYYVHSYAGNDVIIAGNGDNKIFSGKEDDQITVGDGNNYIFANLGDDMIMAGDGDNYIRSGHGDDVIMLGDGRNKVKAHHGDDTVYAGDGGNLIFAGKGHDYVVTGAGDDLILAGSDNDIVYSGAGHDWIFGERGDDAIFAGVGNDVLVGGRGDDLLDGGDGVSESLASSSVSFKSWDGQSDDFTIKAFNQLGETQESFLNITNSGLGVKADPADETTDFNGANRELGYDEETDRSEFIEISFDKDLARAELKLAAFFSDSDSADGPNNEYAKWEAYNEHGKLVGEGEFSASDGNTIVIEDIPRFNMIRLSALPYNNENSGILSDSSDYYIESLDYEYYETVHEATVMYDFAALTMDQIAHEVDFEIRAYELDDDGVQILGEYVDTSDGLGVKGATGGPANQLGYDEGKDNSERLEIEFRTDVNSVTVDIARLFSSESGGNTEFMYWEILKDGQVIDSGSERSPDGSINTSFTVSADAFDTIAFEALPYNNQNNDNVSDSSDYFISKLTATYIDYDKDIAVFRGNRDDYTITHEVDDDGRDYLLVVDSHPNRDGTDKLYDIEILSFKDCEFYINEPNPNPVNHPPTVMLTDTVTSIPEDSDISSNFKVANIVVTDDGLGVNDLSLSGDDKDLFVIIDDMLFLKAGTELDHETLSTLSVSVDVDDAAVGSTPDDTASLVIDVTDVNEVPEVLPETVDLVIDEDTELDYDIPVDQFSDPDGDMLTLSLGTAPDWVSIENGQLVGTPPENFNTGGMPPLTIELIATDPDGLNVTQLISLTVNPVNDAPEVDEIIPDIIMDEDTEVLDLMISPNAFKDVDGDDLTITLENAPDWVTLVDGKLDLIPPANLFGSFTIDIVATDPGGLSATQTVNVVVNSVNDTPTVIPETVDLVIDEDTELEYDIPVDQFSDPDGDMLTLSLGTAPDWVSIENGQLVGTPPENFNTGGMPPLTIELIATDPDGLNVTQLISLTVNPVNDAPEVDEIIPDIIMDEDTEVLDLMISPNAFKDVDGDDLTITLENAPDWVTLVDGKLDLIPPANLFGSFTIDIVATDPGGLSATQTVNVVVNQIDEPVEPKPNDDFDLRYMDGEEDLDGGDGNDTARYVDDTVAKDIRINREDDGSFTITEVEQDENGIFQQDNLKDIENFEVGGKSYDYDDDPNAEGTQNNDLLLGSDQADTIHGKAGSDLVYAGDGDDIIYGDQNPDGSSDDDQPLPPKVLYKPDGETLSPEEIAEAQAVDLSDLEFGNAPSTTVDLSFISEGAGYKNMLGYYLYDESGCVVETAILGKDNPLAYNLSAVGSGGSYQTGDTIDSITIGAGLKLGLFLLPDAVGRNSSSDIASKDVAFYRVDENGDLLLDIDGKPMPATINMVDGSGEDANGLSAPRLFFIESDGSLSPVHTKTSDNASYHTTADEDLDYSLNPDGVVHALNGVAAPDGTITIAFEDLRGGGDEDYDDLIITLNNAVTYDDIIFGGKGDDTIYGDQGDDCLVGEEGDDELRGGTGDDRLVGGDGNDLLVGDECDVQQICASGQTAADWEGISLTAVKLGETLDLFENVDFSDPRGLGVKGGGDSELDYGQNSSEQLIMTFDGKVVLKAEVVVEALFSDEGEGEVGEWIAMRDGQEVGRGTFADDMGDTDGTLTVKIVASEPFDQLIFAARPLGDFAGTQTLENDGDSSDYHIASIKYDFVNEAEFLANAGNDVLEGGRGDDVLEGGRGDDILDGGEDGETIVETLSYDFGAMSLADAKAIPDTELTISVFDQFGVENPDGTFGESDLTLLTDTNQGLGVNAETGGPKVQLGYDPVENTSEAIRFDFANTATKATLELARLFETESRGDDRSEYAKWAVFNGDSLVASGLVVADPGQNIVSFDIIDVGEFDALVLTAVPYGGTSQTSTSDSSDYLIKSLSVETVISVDDDVDIAVFKGACHEYIFTVKTDDSGREYIEVVDTIPGRDGTDILYDIEQFRFKGEPGGVVTKTFEELCNTNGGDIVNPIAVDDMATTDINVPVTFTPEELLNNDIDDGMVGLAIATVFNPVNGTVEIDTDGNVVFTPAQDYVGNEATFEYTLTNGGDIGKVFVNVVDVPENPVAVDDMATTEVDVPVTFTPEQLLGNDIDEDMVGLAIATVMNPVNGTVDIDQDGNVVFTPSPGYFGNEATFEYTLTNGGDVGKVFIDVIPENPVAVDDMASTDINVPVTFTPEQLLGNDIDEDMVGLAIATVMNPVNGTVDIDQNGNVVFTPSPGYLGNEATFEYTLTNGGDVGKVFIDVTNTGQFAIVDAMNDGFVTSNDTPLTLNIASLTQNDLDFDGDPNVFSADIVKMTVAGQEIAINSGDQNPTSVTIDLDHGALQVFSNGVVVYLPDSSLSETVSDTFDYTLQKNGSTIVDDATVAIVSVSDSGGGGGGGGGGGSEDDIVFNEDLFGIDQNSDPQEEKDGAQDPKVFTLEDLIGNLEDPQLKIAGITVASVAFTALANIFDATTGLAKPYADIEALNEGIMITVEREDPLNPGSMITVEAGILLKTVPEGVDPGSATNAQVEFLFMPAQDFFTQLGTQIGEPFEPVGIEYDYIDNGNQIIDSVKVAVKEINDAPVLDVDAPGVITPDSETNMVDVDLDALFSDVDGDELVYTLSPQDESDPMPSWLMISGGRLIGDPTGVEDPAFALKIKADDGRGGTATYEFIVDLTGQFTTEEAQSGDSLFDGQDSQIPDMMAGLIDDTSMSTFVSTSSDDGGGSNPPPPAFDSLDPNMTPESDPNTSMLE